MEVERQKRKGKLEICKGVGECGLGLFMLFLAYAGKDSWEYYLDSDRKAVVDIVSLIGWAGFVLGIIGIVYGTMLVLTADTQSNTVEQGAGKKDERIDWIEGEIIAKEWNPDQHQVEWIVIKQKNGATVRLRHYIRDDAEYKVGDRGWARSKDRLITEFVSRENEEQSR